jgi:trehalose 6-phosphate synthase/phosphatase
VSEREPKAGEALPTCQQPFPLVDVMLQWLCSPELDVFTTVGKKPSAAMNYLHDVNEMSELLESLVKVSTRDQRFFIQLLI